MLPISWTLCTRSTKWGVWLCGQNNLFYSLWAQRDRQLRLFRDLNSDLPEWIRWRRYGTVVLVRCGTRRWTYQKKSFLHHCTLRTEKNQRTWDKLITLMKKVCYQLIPFHTHKYGETRVRTKFRFVSKTQSMSPNGERKNPDSLWKTKRANSRWSQNWDPEARTSSRVGQKKYPGINWNYRFSANGNWSYYYRGVSNPGEINYYFKKKCQNKIGLFVKLVSAICETRKNY